MEKRKTRFDFSDLIVYLHQHPVIARSVNPFRTGKLYRSDISITLSIYISPIYPVRLKSGYLMTNNNRFDTFLTIPQTVLGSPYKALKKKYEAYPNCLLDCATYGEQINIMTVRLNHLSAAISLVFDFNNKCNSVFLYLNECKDEDAFIEYMKENAQYNFKSNCWSISDYYMTTELSQDGTSFCFFR